MIMKKLMRAAIGLMMAISANAQYLNDSGTPFEKGKLYVNASLASTTLTYSKSSDWTLGISAKGGYFIIDNLMGLGVASYENKYNGDQVEATIGAGARWYFDQIGIYAGAIASYVHAKNYGETYNDFLPEIHAGYAFFVSRHLTIEPEIYYQHSFKDSDYSSFGARVGIGVYF